MTATRLQWIRAATSVVIASAFLGTAAATARAEPADPRNELRVTATRGGFQIAGRLSSGPATIRFTNADGAPHALDLYRLAPGVTVGKLVSDVLAGDWAAFELDLADGGPGNGTPNIVSPGRTAVATGDGLRAGDYALVDGTPGLNGVPNFLQGFAAPVTVTAAPAPVAPPVADGVVHIADTGIELPPALCTGHGTFAVEYDGNHEFQLLRLRPGATVQKAFDYWFARFGGQRPAGPAPAEFVGGLADLRPGVHGWVTLDLPPGTYGIWSIEDGDTTDIENGLTATFTVRRNGQESPYSASTSSGVGTCTSPTSSARARASAISAASSGSPGTLVPPVRATSTARAMRCRCSVTKAASTTSPWPGTTGPASIGSNRPSVSTHSIG